MSLIHLHKAQSQHASLEIKDDAIRVSGPMTFTTVPELHKLASRFTEVEKIPKHIDLSGVEQADSSALALLLEWQAWAKQRNHQFELVNVPDSLQALGRVMGVDQLLNMKQAA